MIAGGHLTVIICHILFAFPLQSAELSIAEQYEDFLHAFNKSRDRLTDPSRFKKFSDTLAVIKSHVSSVYSISLNEKADWLDEEVQQLFINMPFSSSSLKSMQSANVEGDSESIPESLNWASYNNKYGYPFTPLVQDQVISSLFFV